MYPLSQSYQMWLSKTKECSVINLHWVFIRRNGNQHMLLAPSLWGRTLHLFTLNMQKGSYKLLFSVHIPVKWSPRQILASNWILIVILQFINIRRYFLWKDMISELSKIILNSCLHLFQLTRLNLQRSKLPFLSWEE